MRVMWTAVGLAAAPLGIVLLVAACGSSNHGNGAGPARNSAATTSALATGSAGVTTPTVANTVSAPTPTPPPPTAPVGGTSASDASGTILTEIATDNRFSQTSYTIMAGHQYTLNFQNSGQALHNWHIDGAKSADGKEIAAPFTDGGKSSSVTFIIDKPGTYSFQCDIHPDEMKGKVTVVP